MADIQRSWDLKRVFLVIGAFEITGFGPDDAMTLAPNGERATHQTGADGETTASKSNDRSHILTVNVMQTGAGFRDLAALAKAQDEAEGIPVLAFMIRDLNTGTTVRSRYATFLTYPELAFGKEAGSVEFQIMLPSPEIEIGSSIV